jgi:hypothetical protein
LKQFELVTNNELEQLESLREEQSQILAKLGRFKAKCSTSTNETITLMSAEIDGLKRQVAENHKIADLVLIEV